MGGGAARRSAWPRYSARPRCPERAPRIEPLARLFDSSTDAPPLRTSERFESGHELVGTGTIGKFGEP